MSDLTVRFTAVGVLLGAALSAQAGTITDWDRDNVVTDSGPYQDDVTYYSTIYDRDVTGGVDGAETNGRIAFTPPDAEAPGLRVVTDGPDDNPNQDFNDCIMASSNTTCEGPFQSGKRFKMQATDTGPIDLVFNTAASEGTTDYRVFHKMSNFTGGQLDGMEVQLGYGVGSDFQPSASGDGLSFVTDTEATDAQEGTSFPFELFGDADEHPKHTLSGFFDPEARAGFDLALAEDSLATGGMYGMYDDFFGDWLDISQVPDGYFWDHDGDPETEDILMAYLNEDGQWEQRREEDNGSAVPVEPFLTDETALQEDGYYQEAITDLANLNLNYYLSVGDMGGTGPETLQEVAGSSFTMRVSTSEVPVPQTAVLLSAGLLALLGGRRKTAS